MKTISVIVPCHNEVESIGPVLEGLRRAVPDAEVIVVDDGSMDGTAQEAARISGVQLLARDKNGGKGIALREGMAAATGDVLVFMDGDGQDAPEDLHLLVEQVKAGSQFVNGSKFIGAMEAGAISLPNYWGNRFMSGLNNLLFGSAITDSQSGFRAISRQVALGMDLSSSQYEIETEMLCRALKTGVHVAEVPVTRQARSGGTTGFRRVRNGLRVLAMILKERTAP